MTRAIARTYSVAYEFRREITYALLMGSVFLISLYILNVYFVISRTVAIQKTEAKLTALSQNVDSLDEQYLSLSNKITPENLTAYGFHEGSVSKFISRSGSLGRLTLNGNEL